MRHARQRIQINGIVQGVGFRPFVYRLAQECRLSGFVHNDANGVLIEIEGAPAALLQFRRRVTGEAPSLARIVDVTVLDLPVQGGDAFEIVPSQKENHPTTLISPDISICEACLQELFDPQDRRYLYPFINCTNCGPRYTIVERIPYDRPHTSMRVFPMCPACALEYHNPADRRFHAQPNACAACGPAVELRDRRRNKLAVSDPIAQAAALLAAGKILAIRGLGGFHLAVDAKNETAVRELRRRKGRAEKPFALMAPDLRTVAKFCRVGPEERELLLAPARPIVLLRKRNALSLAPSVAPGNRFLGVMLPYTPLHHLLLRGRFDALVMTSANLSEEPIAIGNEEAHERLAEIADYFLGHNREIRQRCDDSIARVAGGAPRLIRRSRGYVPAPVPTHSGSTGKRILACGAELKNTIALSRGNAVFFSQHIGDLDNPAAFAFFQNSISHLQKTLEIEPELIACDLHPEYLSTKWARQQRNLPVEAVQHHHAHLGAVMAENEVEDKTVGLILDGTGYGTDGTIWGGEVLIGDAAGFVRHAHLEPVPLPGGEAAIREPWRMALSLLHHAFGAACLDLNLPFVKNLEQKTAAFLLQMLEKQLNSPLTSSCGRYFDAVAALLNLRHRVSFEAQAAIELEMCVSKPLEHYARYSLPRGAARGALFTKDLVRQIVADIRRGDSSGAIAGRFHRAIADLLLAAVRHACAVTGIRTVGLSGGVFQNIRLFEYVLQQLRAMDCVPLTHSQVPTNDGGLALGQIFIANARPV